MNDELEILKRMLPQMAEIMNVVPGNRFNFKDSDTLLILQRRMDDCDIKKALTCFNEVFAGKDGVSVQCLCQCVKGYIQIEVLTEYSHKNFDAYSIRELIKRYKKYSTKVSNIIHLSKVNALTADEFQKEIIALTEQKNTAFMDAFEEEIAALEKKIERMPVPKEEPEVSEPVKGKKSKEELEPVSKKDGFISRFEKKLAEARDKKIVDQELKNVEKISATTKCVEIPFYDKSISFDKQYICKDIPAYSLLKRKNDVYFGLSKNVRKGGYDNRDQSLLELTEATDEFIQFMTENLLSEEYVPKPFVESEKEGMRMYFDFMSRCFEKNIGVTLTVYEYLRFKGYYNRLVQRMFELEQTDKEDYYKALILADKYISYMESYDLECADEEETIIHSIIGKRVESYIGDLDMILNNHIVEESAKADIEELKEKMIHFGETSEVETEKESEPETKIIPLVTEPSELLNMPVVGYQLPMMPFVNQGMMQVVVQFLNQNQEIVDEALYAGNNITKALYDYSTRAAYMKRIGFRNNGQDVFCREDFGE